MSRLYDHLALSTRVLSSTASPILGTCSNYTGCNYDAYVHLSHLCIMQFYCLSDLRSSPRLAGVLHTLTSVALVNCRLSECAIVQLVCFILKQLNIGKK